MQKQNRMVVKTAIRKYADVDGRTKKISADFFGALDREVIALVKAACKRADDNGRNTVMAKDL
jgi:histone H3/H4